MSDGILLHMYRDCGISKGENDIDFIVPLKYVLKVRDAFKKSEHFGVYTQAAGLRRKEVGYHFAGYHIATGVDIDIFTLNEVNGTKFETMWMNHKMHACYLSNETKFGYKLKVNGFEFNVIGPIEDYLERLFGNDWRTPIKASDWTWKNPRFVPYNEHIFY